MSGDGNNAFLHCGDVSQPSGALSACVCVFLLAHYLGRFLGACHEQKEVYCMAGSDSNCMLQQICQGVM